MFLPVGLTNGLSVAVNNAIFPDNFMNNLRVSTAGLGLQSLRWNGISVVAGAAYAAITPPSFTVDKITTVRGAGQGAQTSIVRLTVAAAGTVPAWLFPGVAVGIDITVAGVTLRFSGTVRDVATDGTALDLVSNEQITSLYAAQALDAIAGAVVNSVTLRMQCQKAMLTLPAGAVSVLFSPNAKADGTVLWSQTIAASQEYEITAPIGSKFNLADYYIKSAGADQALLIRFI